MAKFWGILNINDDDANSILATEDPFEGAARHGLIASRFTSWPAARRKSFQLPVRSHVCILSVLNLPHASESHSFERKFYTRVYRGKTRFQ